MKHLKLFEDFNFYNVYKLIKSGNAKQALSTLSSKINNEIELKVGKLKNTIGNYLHYNYNIKVKEKNSTQVITWPEGEDLSKHIDEFNPEPMNRLVIQFLKQEINNNLYSSYSIKLTNDQIVDIVDSIRDDLKLMIKYYREMDYYNHEIEIVNNRIDDLENDRYDFQEREDEEMYDIEDTLNPDNVLDRLQNLIDEEEETISEIEGELDGLGEEEEEYATLKNDLEISETNLERYQKEYKEAKKKGKGDGYKEYNDAVDSIRSRYKSHYDEIDRKIKTISDEITSLDKYKNIYYDRFNSIIQDIIDNISEDIFKILIPNEDGKA